MCTVQCVLCNVCCLICTPHCGVTNSFNIVVEGASSRGLKNLLRDDNVIVTEILFKKNCKK